VSGRATFSVLAVNPGSSGVQRKWSGFSSRAEAERFASRQLEVAKGRGWSIRFEVREAVQER